MQEFFSITTVGWLAVVLSMCAYMPQAYATLKTGNTDGLSLSGFLIIVGSLICWFIYGFAKNDYPLMISCGVSFVNSGIILFFILRRRLPVIAARIKNRKAAADVGLLFNEGLPPVTEFNKKTRFIRPGRFRRHRRPQK